MLFIVRFQNHLAHMFNIIERCVMRKNCIGISKVKVTLSKKVKNDHKWSCPGYNYVIHCEILKLLGTCVHKHWTMCHAKELRQYLHGQGHTFLSSKMAINDLIRAITVILCQILKWKCTFILFTVIGRHVMQKNSRVQRSKWPHDNGVIILKNRIN